MTKDDSLAGACLDYLNKGIIEMGIPEGRAGDGTILNLIVIFNRYKTALERIEKRGRKDAITARHALKLPEFQDR